MHHKLFAKKKQKKNEGRYFKSEQYRRELFQEIKTVISNNKEYKY